MALRGSGGSVAASGSDGDVRSWWADVLGEWRPYEQARTGDSGGHDAPDTLDAAPGVRTSGEAALKLDVLRGAVALPRHR